ncbi:hypothetical protein ACL6C3_11030 [Capilliphycus salinus ALCB114379]|uniref:hypothetical protein n=1 Tax=Capilliphycus salinus TaxID=2768948 RepID=UPI0039A47D1F
MLKPLLLSVFSLLYSGLFTSSSLLENNLSAQLNFSNQLQTLQAQSEFSGLIFLNGDEQNTEDGESDASRGDTRRTSS